MSDKTNNLQISFGPVQEFVAEARKTRDSWAGSYLLAYLAGKAIYAADKQGCEIVSPSVTNDRFYSLVKTGSQADLNAITKRIGTLPNIFAIDIESCGNPDQVAKSVIDGWANAWKRIEDNVRALLILQVDARIEGACLDTIWYRQVNKQWYYFWAFGEGKDLGARKNIRNFGNINANGHFDQIKVEPCEKCTVCGKREVLHPFENPAYSRLTAWWEGEDGFARRINDAVGGFPISLTGERLCAVCLVKRLFPYLSEEALQADDKDDKDGTKTGWEVPINYPSTSTMAVRDWWIKQFTHFENSKDLKTLETIAEEYAATLEDVNKYFEAKLGSKQIGFEEHNDNFGLDYDYIDQKSKLFELSGFDGDVFLPTGVRSLVKGNLPEEHHEDLEEHHEDLKEGIIEFILNGDKDYKGLDYFLSEVGKLYDDTSKYRKPNRFYAVMMMDGDNMGAVLSGLDKAGKSELSNALSDFAMGVPIVVEGDRKEFADAIDRSILLGINSETDDPGGYPGGVTLYAGGDDVVAFLPVSQALSVCARLKSVYEKIVNSRDITDEPLTTSAAVIFAPNNVPLRAIMKRLHSNLERKAKDEADRNAISIEVWKGGGPVYSFAEKWEKGVEYDEDATKYNRSIDMTAKIKELTKQIRDGDIPNGFLFKVVEYAKLFTEHPFDDRVQMDDLLFAEFKKTRDSKLFAKDDTEEEKDEKVRGVTKAVLDLCWIEKEQCLNAEPLMVARFLAQNEM